MQVNQKTDPSSTNEFTIYDIRFTIHNTQYTRYDLRFKIYASTITHTHILLIFKNNLRKSAQTIRENLREIKRKNQRETKNKNNPQETRKNKKIHIRLGVNLFAFFASLKKINKR